MSPRRSLRMYLAITGLAASVGSALPTDTSAQSAGAASPERIRAQALRMKEYRDLLNDRDANVRMAALDEMIKSSDNALREVAYDAAFSSADQTMRALALRTKLLSMKTLVVDLENSSNMPEAQWAKLVEQFQGTRVVLTIDKTDPQTGTFTGAHGSFTVTGVISGQELTSRLYGGGSLRLRLGDAGVMTGTVSQYGRTAPAKLTLH